MLPDHTRVKPTRRAFAICHDSPAPVADPSASSVGSLRGERAEEPKLDGWRAIHHHVPSPCRHRGAAARFVGAPLASLNGVRPKTEANGRSRSIGRNQFVSAVDCGAPLVSAACGRSMVRYVVQARATCAGPLRRTRLSQGREGERLCEDLADAARGCTAAIGDHLFRTVDDTNRGRCPRHDRSTPKSVVAGFAVAA